MTSPNKCILCNNSSVFPLAFIKNYRKLGKRIFIRCPECDLIFVPEDFHLSPHDEAARYLLHQNTLSNEGYVNIFKEKISLIDHYCPGINSILDYGCGPEPVLAELLKRNGPGCDVFDPFFFPDFPEHSYDLIISTEAFEHFRDVRKDLEKINSLLGPGGFLAIMTSFHDSIDDFKEWWYPGDPTHISFFSGRTFDWISKHFRFNIIFSNNKNFIILQME